MSSERSDRAADRRARALLSGLAEGGESAVNAALDELGAPAVVDRIAAGTLRLPRGARTPWQPVVTDAAAMAARLRQVDVDGWLAAATACQARFAVPGDPEWPGCLEELGAYRPYGLWLRGPLALDEAVARSVSVVGSRAATGYGEHVASEIGFGVAERLATVVSGAAYGIDAAAHRGCLAAGGATVAVLGCGVDRSYPAGNSTLIGRVAQTGLLLSEVPPGTAPTRVRFLVRNRLVAALTGATVVVEAGLRSGALSTAGRAADLGRPVGAVPGPVTSAMSAGCHQLLRNGAVCVTDAADVMELAGRIGEDLGAPRRGDDRMLDSLPPSQRAMLEAFPRRRPVSVDELAVRSGLPIGQAMAELGALLAVGLVHRTGSGWVLDALVRRS